MDNPRYNENTIDGLIIDKNCVECSGKDLTCNYIFMCDVDRTCIFRSMYEDMFKGKDSYGNKNI